MRCSLILAQHAPPHQEVIREPHVFEVMTNGGQVACLQRGSGTGQLYRQLGFASQPSSHQYAVLTESSYTLVYSDAFSTSQAWLLLPWILNPCLRDPQRCFETARLNGFAVYMTP